MFAYNQLERRKATVMNELNWSEDYSVGIPTIDNEHKLLVSMVNDINRILDTHQDFQIQIVNDILKKLTYCIRRHFESEEGLLLLNNYPKYEAHKAEHAILLEQLDIFEKNFKDSKKSFTEEMLFYLEDWLVRHIILHDCEFGFYFRGKKIIYPSV